MSAFHPIRRLTAGGMAEVFLAMQLGIEGFEKLVVLKQILPHLRQDEDFVQMFLEEARLAAALHHPNIVTTLDVHRDESSFFIALEYISGEDLRYVLGKLALRKERIPLPIACRILADVAAALDYAHTLTDATGRPRGIVHRDVGPSNIIVDYQGVTRLVDFGIAKANAGSVYTKPGVVKGKFGYMAPEHVQHRPLDHRADIFSLGIVMHEVFTGRRLFKEATLAAVVQALVNRPAPPPSEVQLGIPPELDRVVLAALEKDRDARTQSAHEVLEELEAILHHLGPASHSDVATWMQKTFAERQRNRQAVEREVVLQGRNLQNHELDPDHDIPFAPMSQDLALSSVGSGLSNTPTTDNRTGPRAPNDTGSFLGTQVQTGSHLSAVGQVSYGQTQAQPQTKGKTALIIALLVVILLLVGSVAYLLGRGGNLPPPQVTKATQVTTPSPSAAKASPSPVKRSSPTTKTATLIVHVNPPGASVTIADKRFDDVGPTGTMVPVPGDALFRVVIEKKGFARSLQQIRLPADTTEHLHVNLKPQGAATAVASVEHAGTIKASSAQASAPPAKAKKAKKVRWHPRHTSRRGKKKPKGKLLIGFTPAAATLTLDGSRVAGSSPMDISGISTGAHLITPTAAGYNALTRTVTVKKGQPLRLNLTLSRAGPAWATLDISSTPPGASVTVDGRARGKTPLRGLRLSADSFHKIQLTRAGFQPWTSRLAPTEGKNPPLHAALKPLAVAAAPAKPIARPTTAPPATPTTTRVSPLILPRSTQGNAARGRSLFGRRCNSCHGKTTPHISSKRYTQKQWSRYFANGRHYTRAPFRKFISKAQLADVKAFLMSRAADVESATAAGVR